MNKPKYGISPAVKALPYILEYNRPQSRLFGEPNILPFRYIKVTLPRKFLLKKLRSTQSLTLKEGARMRQKLVQIDIAINQLRHAQSLVERVYARKGST